MSIVRKVLERIGLVRHPRRRLSGPISDAISSRDGQIALARAMIEPIKMYLEYQAIGRRLLMVDELPGGFQPVSFLVLLKPPAGFVRVEGSRVFAPISVFNNRITRFRLVRRRRSIGM